MKPRRAPTLWFFNNRSFWRVDLRAKLTLANMLITLAAVVGMGYYVYYRTQDSSATLISQLESNVRSKVEADLSGTSRERATLLNDFFSSMSRTLATIDAMEEDILAQDSTLGDGKNWSADRSLSRLGNGSWDNANTEASSIFLPASADLTTDLVSKLNILKQTDLAIPAILNNNPDIIAIYFGGVRKETIYYPNVDLANIVPPDFDVTGRTWYLDASPENNPDGKVIWSTPYEDAALNGLVITTSMPVFGPQEKFEGVTAMDIQLTRITDLVSNVRVGETGYAFLVDKDGRLIALPEAGYRDFGVTSETVPLGEPLDSAQMPNMPAEVFDILGALSSGENKVTVVTLGGTERFLAYHQVPEVQYSLAIIVPTDEMLVQSANVNAQITEETNNIVRVSIILIASILGVAALATLWIVTLLTTPLKSLTKTANEITMGNMDARAEVRSRDEIGILADTLNAMTSTLRDSIHSLEQRAADRTSEIERRSNLLKAVAGVGKGVTSFRDLSELLQQTTYLIHENFGYYHVGIFLLDEYKEYAVLRATNSEGGRRMLERKHQLKVGETGIVGYVTQHARARIALDVGMDAVYFDNPDLPDTRSEMALPLVVGGQILGALDVQSTEAQAFTEDDSATLQILAEQIAVAIQNANLFAETEKALDTARAAYSELSREAWGKILRNQQRIGFIATPGATNQTSADTHEPGIAKAYETGALVVGSDNLTISIPVKVRGQTIGAIRMKKAEIAEAWTQEETNLAIALSDQLSGALESARLYRESQQRGARESLVSDISARISAVSNTDAIVRETVQELGQALGNAVITFQLLGGDNGQGAVESNNNGKAEG
ncbi:MAG: GAF domain-containing protein [Chloroflexi bacterium]|nr:GAF domain-containing protein [Chloroflexota bacterium]